MSRIRLTQLEILLAVVAEGSFSAAAATLGCTQSRVSCAIADLEGVVGKRLLTRSRRGSVPTAAGDEAVATARQILQLVGELEGGERTGENLQGTIRLACFRAAGTHLVPTIVSALFARLDVF